MTGTAAQSQPRPAAALEGVIPILVTPFASDDSIDFDQLGREIDFLSDCGIKWAGFGFGSEMPSLDNDEAIKLMEFAAVRAGDRLSLIGNAEVTSTRAGVDAVRRAGSTGVELVMLRPAGLGECDQESLFEALAEVSAASPVGCIIQDAPQNTGVQLTAQTLARLLTEVAGVAAVKVEPRPSAPKIGAIVEALAGRPGTVLGGSGASDLIFELDRGASGTMPGPAVPDLLAEICRLHAAGDRSSAAALFRDYLPLAALGRGMASFLYSQKYILHLRGVLDEPRLRRPHGAIDPRLKGEIDSVLQAPALREAVERNRRCGSVAISS